VEPGGPDEIARLAYALNRMAESLQRIEHLRRDLVANVAHELRTPLSTLRGYIEALHEGVATADPEILALLHEEVLRLVRLVDALHQLSEFDARISRPPLTEVDLPALIRRLLDTYGAALNQRTMTARAVYGPEAMWVRADPDLVEQALRNLLDNAVRYARDGAEVIVATSRHNGTIQITVQNAGEGISADDLPHIFERFYRGEKSRSRETGGVGIGLALVQEIARTHGGGTCAASADGVTTVWFSLALRPGALKAGSAPPAAERRTTGETALALKRGSWDSPGV
jgi:signal transduction histidine kinase